MSMIAALILGAVGISVQVAKFPSHTRVLFQGDSITDMNRGRSEDPNHILGHSYAFLIAAKAAATYPERDVVFLNRGISGNRVTDLQDRWRVDTIELKPDLLSILIGVNDLTSGVPAADFEASYDQLLTATVAALPKTQLVLCEPFGLPTGRIRDTWSAYQPELVLRQAIVKRLAVKFHATFVPLQAAFDSACKRASADHWIWDGVHPTYGGQQIIADAWVKAVHFKAK